MCSTPCGIRGFCTINCRPERRGSLASAQRLAASEVFARKLTSPPPSARSSCSTPCGIRGFCTGNPRLAQFPRPVLNALRHQRFLHIERLSRVGTEDVLNALRHQRFLHKSRFSRTPPRVGSSAQRLAASEVFAPRRWKPLRDKRRNATLQASYPIAPLRSFMQQIGRIKLVGIQHKFPVKRRL